jgi:hypothetical protein
MRETTGDAPKVQRPAKPKKSIGCIEAWTSKLPDAATVERVTPTFWYVRIPGVARSWIPVEIDASGERTVKLTSHVIIEPEENVSDVYAFLLRRNHDASGVAFSIDGREGVLCLVTRIEHDAFDETKLDEAVGSIVQQTEEVFRSILELGFGSRLRKR